MTIRKNGYIGMLVEQKYPVFLSIIIAVAATYIFIKYPITLREEIGSVINNLIVFVSIIIGFIGVLLGVLLSLKNEKIILILFELKAKDTLKQYFRAPIFNGTSSILFGCIIFFHKAIDSLAENIYGQMSLSECAVIMWIFFTVNMLLTAHRLLNIMFELVFSDRKVQEREIIVEDEKKVRDLKEKHSG